MPHVEIRKAIKADAVAILEILQSVALWLETAGPGKLWSASSFSLSGVVDRIEAEEAVVLEADGTVAAIMYLQGRDDIFWPDDPAGEALYIHKLAIARRFAGLGLSRLMLDWAADQARQAGRHYLRLDCAPRAKLIAIYRDAGFSRVGDDIVVEGYSVARLQRNI